jgi:hypothetical protein
VGLLAISDCWRASALLTGWVDFHFGLPAVGTLAGAAAQLELDQQAFFRLNAVISVVFLVVTLTEIVFPFLRIKR